MVTRGEGSGEGAHDTLLSVVRYTTVKWSPRNMYETWVRGLVVVQLLNKPTDLSVCVCEERGHGEGGVPYLTLLSGTL